MFHIKKFFRKLIIIDSQTTYGEIETKTFRRIYVCQRFIGVSLAIVNDNISIVDISLIYSEKNSLQAILFESKIST